MRRRELSDRARARRWRTPAWQPSNVVTMLTDFGTSDPYVGIMGGVVLDAAPGARLVDLTHSVPPQDVVVGALLLRSAVPYFTKGTVHLAVVDPGVGGERNAIVVSTKHAVFVGPDNGLLYPSAELLGSYEVRRIEADHYFRKPVSDTFHGRDVFAPIAGQIAAGRPPSEMGPVLPAMQPLAVDAVSEQDGVLIGRVVHVDHFGNLITNIAVADLPAGGFAVGCGDRQLGALVRSYSEVDAGALLAIEGSWGMLEIAVREGSAAATLAVGRGAEVRVERSTAR